MLGLTDELIQHQVIRAQEGYLPAILAMGDLYYYGARGYVTYNIYSMIYIY